MTEETDVVLPANSLHRGYTEVVREIEACVEDLGRSSRPRISPLSVFDVAECQQHGSACYYDCELGLMISMTEPLPSWTHS